MKVLRRLLIAALIAAIAYPAWLSYRIWQQSHKDENHSADAIVVLGAAQYNGVPSPVLAARLDHALYLYRQGFATTIVVTGGKQVNDRFTEAEAGRRYLTARGVPDGRVLSEDRGRTTLESLRGVRDIADRAGIDTVVLVSDPLHSERIKRIAQDLGFAEAYTSPASYVDLNRSRITKAKELLHELGSLLLYELFER